MESIRNIVPVNLEEEKFLNDLEQKLKARLPFPEVHGLYFKCDVAEEHILQHYVLWATVVCPHSKKTGDTKEETELKNLAKDIASDGFVEYIRNSFASLIRFRKIRVDTGHSCDTAVERFLTILELLEKQKERRNKLLDDSLECLAHITERINDNIRNVNKQKKHLLKNHEAAAIKLRDVAISIAEKNAGITKKSFGNPHPHRDEHLMRAMEIPMRIEKCQSGLSAKYHSILHDRSNLSQTRLAYKTFLSDVLYFMSVIYEVLVQEVKKFGIYSRRILIKDVDSEILQKTVTTYTGFLKEATQTLKELEEKKKAVDMILSQPKTFLGK